MSKPRKPVTTAYTYVAEVEVQRTPWPRERVWWGTLSGAFLLSFPGAVLGTILAYVLINQHNALPKTKKVKKRLPLGDEAKKACQEALRELEQEYQTAVDFLEETTQLTTFFKYLKQAQVAAQTALKLQADYQLPRELAPALPEAEDTAALAKHFEADFIPRYYQKAKAEAQSLKTQQGIENRLERCRADLLQYENDLSPHALDLIDQLWA